MLQEDADLVGIFLLFLADSLLDVLVVSLFDPETGHREFGFPLFGGRLGQAVVTLALDLCLTVELLLF